MSLPNLSRLSHVCAPCGVTRQEFSFLLPGLSLAPGQPTPILAEEDYECQICQIHLNYPASGFKESDGEIKLLEAQLEELRDPEQIKAAKATFHEAALAAAQNIRLSDPARTQVEVLLPGCGHQFHRQCLSTWVNSQSENSDKCLCRTPIDTSILQTLRPSSAAPVPRGLVRERSGAASTIAESDDESHDESDNQFNFFDNLSDDESDDESDHESGPDHESDHEPEVGAEVGVEVRAADNYFEEFGSLLSNLHRGIRFSLRNYALRPDMPPFLQNLLRELSDLGDEVVSLRMIMREYPPMEEWDPLIERLYNLYTSCINVLKHDMQIPFEDEDTDNYRAYAIIMVRFFDLLRHTVPVDPSTAPFLQTRFYHSPYGFRGEVRLVTRD